MAELRTEEEQIEAIKNWWKENGRSTVLGILLAVVAVFGWRTWQDYDRTQAENASILYSNLAAAAQVQPGQQLSEERRKSAEYNAGRLIDEYGSSIYASYARLWLASLNVQDGKLDEAASRLEEVIAAAPEAGLVEVAKLRLARVKSAQGDHDGALAAMGSAPLTGFEALWYETRGDILLASGDRDGARSAYEQARSHAGGVPQPLLAMKLDDLATAEAN